MLKHQKIQKENIRRLNIALTIAYMWSAVLTVIIIGLIIRG